VNDTWPEPPLVDDPAVSALGRSWTEAAADYSTYRDTIERRVTRWGWGPTDAGWERLEPYANHLGHIQVPVYADGRLVRLDSFRRDHGDTRATWHGTTDEYAGERLKAMRSSVREREAVRQLAALRLTYAENGTPHDHLRLDRDRRPANQLGRPGDPRRRLRVRRPRTQPQSLGADATPGRPHSIVR
jgi:hypothetical protein